MTFFKSSVMFLSLCSQHSAPVAGFIKSVRAAGRPFSSTAHRAVTTTSLPEFSSKEEYMQFISKNEVSALPKGFSCGSAKGSFVSVEAPLMGSLPIKATVVYLDEPTESWAACFTKNKVM